MNLRHLVTFQEIVRAGSFSKAARAVQSSQSTITLHVQELEREMGTALFRRRGRHTSLTEAGDALASRAGSVLDGLETLKRTMTEIAAGQAGELRIACVEPAASVKLLPILARFCRERPRLQVRIEAGGTQSVAQAVADGRVDFGLASAPPPGFRLGFEPWFLARMVLLLPKRHPLASASRIKARDVKGLTLLLTEQGCAYRDAIEAALRAAGAEAHCSMQIGSLRALTRAVQLGLGAAILPRDAADPLPAGTVARDIAGVDLSLAIGIVQRSDGVALTPAAAAFIEALRSERGA
jgi:LysR family transcriptional regulator, regulator of the ytmI operon